MTQNLRLFKKELPPWTPFALAALAAFLYLIESAIYAYTNIPGLDEGSYLLKGYLYARGAYAPFEPYGPLTNKAPFAFLIPGFFEWLFGPGLRTGRFFSVALGLLAVLGVWLTARRWGGAWAAAGSVWVFALSGMIVKVHAIAASEVIIAAMLAWICVFTLAEDRPLWQILLGSLLAALAVVTRQNMIPLLPFLALYIFWQHGKQKGIWSLATMTFIFLAVHIYYFPGILAIWTPWLPENLVPFLDSFRMPADSTPLWSPVISAASRVLSFFQGVRNHFVIVVGSFFALMFASAPRRWKSAAGFRAAVFLGCLYFALFLLHAWATVASQYEHYSCVYCFSNYLTFFDPIGILFVIVMFSEVGQRPLPRAAALFVVPLILLLSAGIGFSLFESVNRSLLDISVPRLRGGSILPGSTLLVDLLTNKFSWELSLVKKNIAATLGLLAGVAAVGVAFLVWRRGEKKSFASVLIHSYLALGFLFLPFLNVRDTRVDCQTDLIAANEQVGGYLAEVIPPNSLVYWDGGLSVTPLTYAPQARIFPPQINSAYTFRIGGDPQTLFYFSHWNQELAEQWKASADVFIIEAKRYATWREFLSQPEFEEYAPPPIPPSCKEGSALRIFHRKP